MIGEWGHGWDKGGLYDGFPVQSFTIAVPGKMRRLNGLIHALKYLADRRNALDILHLHGGYYASLLLAAMVKFLLRKKTMLKITSSTWDNPQGVANGKYGRVAAVLYRQLDGVVAMTTGQVTKCRSFGYKRQLQAVPNGIDETIFCPVDEGTRRRLRSIHGIPDNSIVLAYAGWLGYGKGTDVLFHVWKRLLGIHGNVVLLCIGDYGTEASTPEALATFLASHGVDPSLATCPLFHYTGLVPSIEQYLQMSDIFLFPSRSEGFGTVQVEAMACGLPCVVNDIPEVSSDIFPDTSCGYRVKNNDIDEYSAICGDLIAHPEKRRIIGRNARQRAVTCFSIDVVADAYVTFYSALLNGRQESGSPERSGLPSV